MTPRSRQLVAQQLPLVFDGPAAASPPRPATAEPRAPIDQAKPGDEPPPGVRLHRAQLAGQSFVFRLRRGKRRTIGFQIDDAGLTVSAPRWVSLREIEAAVVEKERWIRAKLGAWRDWAARRRLPEVRWADGGTLPYVGRTLTLRLTGRTQLVETFAAPELHLALPADASADQVKDTAVAWLHAQARHLFDERIEHLASISGKRPSAWTLSSARSQWGSCTHDGRVRLNWRLIHFALPLIDYVIAHELAHLQELNHGPGFWSAVSRLLPGFEAARDEIKGVDMASLPA